MSLKSFILGFEYWGPWEIILHNVEISVKAFPKLSSENAWENQYVSREWMKYLRAN